MHPQGHLSHKFTSASTAAERDEDNINFPTPPGVPLTAGEAAFVKSIFGDAIDTRKVKKYYSAKVKPGTEKGFVIPAETFGDDCIKFYGPQYKVDDYSKTNNIFNFGTFIHEMTHIWQNQNNIPSKLLPDGSDIYNYTLTPTSTFSDFGWEQQAKLIENYARTYLYSTPVDKEDPLLQKVVEDEFPQARKTRLKLEAQEKSTPPAKISKFG